MGLLELLTVERDRLAIELEEANRAIARLGGTPQRKRVMSASARAKISRAQKARWAKERTKRYARRK